MLLSLIRAFKAFRDYQRNVAELSQLSDRELADIGIAELRGWLAAQRAAGLSSATMARRATAARMAAASSAGVDATASMPAASRRSRVSARAKLSAIARCTRSISAAGVPAGANTACADSER